jgi:hypothetical protein
MEALESFEQNRRVIEDLTTRTLAAIPTEHGRLCYLASLCDDSAGGYRHDGLSALYPEPVVQAAVAYCHAEIFGRVLEMPLEQQEWDLRSCLSDFEGTFRKAIAHWMDEEPYSFLIPDGQPAYLRELYLSNVRTLLAMLAEELAIERAAA